MAEEYSYQGLTVVVSGQKLTTKQIMEVVPFINDHHDGRLTHGELITKKQRSLVLKSAVCMLVARGDRYLSISRRNDATRWGLPGGKVDPYEANVEAICREVEEETGVIAAITSYEPIYSGFCPGEVSYWVTTYLFVDPYPIKDSELKPEEGMTLDWKSEEELCDPSISPFADYNKRVFDALRAYQQGERE